MLCMIMEVLTGFEETKSGKREGSSPSLHSAELFSGEVTFQ